MPKRHRNLNNNRKSPGHNQDPGSRLFLNNRRALPALPGRAPQVGEAELLHCVTKAPAEPLIGAIPVGPSNIASKPLGFSLVPPEVDDRKSRARGMGHKPDGSSHPSSISTIPLRPNDNDEESLLMSAPSPSGDTPAEQPLILANSGFDPTNTAVYELSEMEAGRQQDGTKEQTTNPDIPNEPILIDQILNDNIVSHISDIHKHKKLNISGSTVGPEVLANPLPSGSKMMNGSMGLELQKDGRNMMMEYEEEPKASWTTPINEEESYGKRPKRSEVCMNGYNFKNFVNFSHFIPIMKILGKTMLK